MKRTALAVLLLASAPAVAQICIVEKDGCKDIASGKVYEQQDGAYVDPETKEIKVVPAKEYKTAYPAKAKPGKANADTRIKARLQKMP